jgi:methylmalonyl-CoA mutase
MTWADNTAATCEVVVAQVQTTLAAWRAQVEKELKGVPFEKALTTSTWEGITLQPLYTEATPLPALAGRSAPLVHAVEADAAAVPAQLEEATAGGAQAAWLRTVTVTQLEALAPFLKTFRAVRVDATADWASVANILLKHGTVNAVLAVDPLQQTVCGSPRGLKDGLAPAVALHRTAPASWKLCGVSVERHHAAGAHAVQELGILLASGVASLRVWESLGVAPQDAAARMVFTVPVGRDVFMELCKLRAARLLWARVLEACGVKDTRMMLHACGSARTVTAYDAHVNMLRGTTQAFSAMLGGADWLTVTPWDQRLASRGAKGTRAARNTGLVLQLESHLDAVDDPAGGSFFLDALTQQLCERGWAFFQEVERQGGMGTVLASGWLWGQVEKTAQQRRDAQRKRKEPVTGVSEYALSTDAPLLGSAPSEGWPVMHDGDVFEVLRQRTSAQPVVPRVFLARLGPATEATAREQFADHALAAGGFDVHAMPVSAPWNPADLAPVVHAFTHAQAHCTCVCGTDEQYAQHAVELTRRLKAAGARHVILAGRPGALEADLRAAGVDAFLHLGCDVVGVLEGLLPGSG